MDNNERREFLISYLVIVTGYNENVFKKMSDEKLEEEFERRTGQR